jgi:hypothetical protein
MIMTTAMKKLIRPRSSSEYPKTMSNTQSQKYAASEITLNKLSHTGRNSNFCRNSVVIFLELKSVMMIMSKCSSIASRQIEFSLPLSLSLSLFSLVAVGALVYIIQFSCSLFLEGSFDVLLYSHVFFSFLIRQRLISRIPLFNILFNFR